LRVELRYGNKLRVLSSEMLRRPADFFAGASDWHSATLAVAQSGVCPESVPCSVRLPLETVKAEVVRNLRWVMETAAPSIAAAWDYLGQDFEGESQFLSVVTNKALPGRLKKFSPLELKAAFSSGFSRYFAGAALPAAA